MRNPYHKPRIAHCLGCGQTFPKMHLLRIHRGVNRCGGRFLPDNERELIEAASKHYKKWDIIARDIRGMSVTDSAYEDTLDQLRWHYSQYRDMMSRFYLLRQNRIAESLHQ